MINIYILYWYVLSGYQPYADLSQQLISSYSTKGALRINHIIYTELAPNFTSKQQLDDILFELDIVIDITDEECAFLAGRKWAEYRKNGGSRTRVLPDFFIEAQALLKGDYLLSRDRGLYQTYFPELNVVYAG